MLVPGGGLSADGRRWIACRPHFFLHVRVLSRRFRRRFLEMLTEAHDAGCLSFFNDHQPLADKVAFKAYLDPLRKTDWAVYAKDPFSGPRQVLAYLARYTHRVAIANRRLIAVDDRSVTFKWKDYRIEGADRYTTMTLDIHEFIRRFLLHVFPKRFHRIRSYGMLANGHRAAFVAKARELLAMETKELTPGNEAAEKTDEPDRLCPCCGGRMVIVETFEPGCSPRHHPPRAPPQTIKVIP